MKLSANFSLAEFTKSQTAIRKGISNVPEEWNIINMKNLCINILQPLREWYNKSITINSGFRSKELNEAIGGAKYSQHATGCAVDIDTVDDNADLFFYIKMHLPFDQLIWEFGDHTNPAWVHVSFSIPSKNRGEVLRAEKVNGKTHYTKMT